MRRGDGRIVNPHTEEERQAEVETTLRVDGRRPIHSGTGKVIPFCAVNISK